MSRCEKSWFMWSLSENVFAPAAFLRDECRRGVIPYARLAVLRPAHKSPGGNVRGASARASLGGDGCASDCRICGELPVARKECRTEAARQWHVRVGAVGSELMRLPRGRRRGVRRRQAFGARRGVERRAGVEERVHVRERLFIVRPLARPPHPRSCAGLLFGALRVMHQRRAFGVRSAMDRGRRRTSAPGTRYHCRGRRAEVRPVGYCNPSQPGPRVSVWAVALPSVGHVKPRNTVE